jgi:hypothetical protein
MTRILIAALLPLLLTSGFLQAQVSVWGVEFHFVEFRPQDDDGNYRITVPLVQRFQIETDGDGGKVQQVGSIGSLKGTCQITFRSVQVRDTRVRANLDLTYRERRSSSQFSATVELTSPEVHTILSHLRGGPSRGSSLFTLRIPLEQPPEDPSVKPWPVDSYARWVLESVRKQESGNIHAGAQFLQNYPLAEVFTEPEILELRRDIKDAALRYTGGHEHLPSGTVSSLLTLLAATGDVDALKRIITELDFRPDLAPLVQRCLKDISDPHVYGEVVMSLLQSSSFKRREAFSDLLDPLISRLEGGTAILPGGPEEQARTLDAIKRMRAEKQVLPPLLMLLIGGASIALVAFALHRLALRLTT